MELWKDYNGYKVSNTGKVMGKIGTVLAQRKNYKKGKGKRPNSYCWIVSLGKNKHNVHHLVAKCFLPPKPSDGLYCIDHIDGNRLNNCIENLREATASQNGQNKKLSKNNTSGIKGVYFTKWNKWVAQLKINNKIIYLGSFDDIKLAEIAVKEARSKNHGVFARHS